MCHLLQWLHISLPPNVDISNPGPSPELHTCIYNHLLQIKLSVSKTKFIVLHKPASAWISCSGEGHGQLTLVSEKKLGTKEVAMGMEKGDQGHEIGRGRKNPGSR